MIREMLVKMSESQRCEPAAETTGDMKLSRRSFVQLVGAGLLITVMEGPSLGRRGDRDRASMAVAARVRLDTDGTFTVMTGKVEEGQGSRAQLTQAAAEELQVPADRVHLIMADTALVPDDGITAGSRTTPSTVPAVRQGAATARELLKGLAAKRWKLDGDTLKLQNGVITNTATKETISYADLAKAGEVEELFKQSISSDVAVMNVSEWDVLGTSVPRPNARDLVTGAHRYPSDVIRPNMLYGKTLAHPSSKELSSHLKKHARSGARPGNKASVEKGLSEADKVLSATYEAAYIQHVPMEPRAAVAEWNDDKLTVWAGVDWPQRAQRDLAGVFDIPTERVRAIVPDMGGGFGGKHSAEAAEEAARLAKAAGRPVSVRWTRAEEFTWAYFRPAAVIECKAGLDASGRITAWDFATINPGGAAMDTPYAIANTSIASVGTDSPLRQGPYRCLGATVNNFARESFMDELAAAAGADPLAFRLAHLDNPRIHRVLETAAKQFDWPVRKKKITAEVGVGLACGTEKNSVVAACVEVEIDRKQGAIKVREVCEAFECGPIQNPANLTSQVQGCIIMGLGGALSEEIQFENGKILNAGFSGYQVPRFRDVPRIDVHLIDNRDIPSAGGGETPIIAVAPAIGNAVFAATGVRIRSMPMRGLLLRQA